MDLKEALTSDIPKGKTLSPDVQDFLDQYSHLKTGLLQTLREPQEVPDFPSSPGLPIPDNGLPFPDNGLPFPEGLPPYVAPPTVPHLPTLQGVPLGPPPLPVEAPSLLQGGNSVEAFVKAVQAVYSRKDWYLAWRQKQTAAGYPRAVQYPGWLIQEARRRTNLLLKEEGSDFLTAWCSTLLEWSRPWGASFAAQYLASMAMALSLNEVVNEWYMDKTIDRAEEEGTGLITDDPEDDEDEDEDEEDADEADDIVELDEGEDPEDK